MPKELSNRYRSGLCSTALGLLAGHLVQAAGAPPFFCLVLTEECGRTFCCPIATSCQVSGKESPEEGCGGGVG
jgi:hypothetical protein